MLKIHKLIHQIKLYDAQGLVVYELDIKARCYKNFESSPIVHACAQNVRNIIFYNSRYKKVLRTYYAKK